MNHLNNKIVFPHTIISVLPSFFFVWWQIDGGCWASSSIFSTSPPSAYYSYDLLSVAAWQHLPDNDTCFTRSLFPATKPIPRLCRSALRVLLVWTESAEVRLDFVPRYKVTPDQWKLKWTSVEVSLSFFISTVLQGLQWPANGLSAPSSYNSVSSTDLQYNTR